MNKLSTSLDLSLTQQGIALGEQARKAASHLARVSSERKKQALLDVANALINRAESILEANAEDYTVAERKGVKAAFLDRLRLDEGRLSAMAESVRAIAGLQDPVGEEIARWQVPSGLDIARVHVPLGVIGIIYESRPNVTVDATALSLMAGNAVILRGGSECAKTNHALAGLMSEALSQAGLPDHVMQMVPTQDRDFVALMLTGLGGGLDVIVPRGGRSLVERVQAEARIPVFSHLEGVCHTYIHPSARPEMARDIVVNAKLRRTGICGALECLLIDEQALESHAPLIVSALRAQGCTIKGDDKIMTLFDGVELATNDDWGKEFGEAILAVHVVSGLDQALEFIDRFGSHHTDAIIAEDAEAVQRFFNEVDSAVIMHNASTQFSDGGEFGFGAEIGIATGRMHARGPIGVEQLTCFKYLVRGHGQTRP